ncbi:hypothetical protein [Macrococcoides canis]|uniref:hypothetical protein n=1 Tax=Macrococcoides canis TaxID=1855823 RepID=UPI00165D5D4B|nr:hypothetical protein [Macrococcus canis]QNR07758.1 hypothetical protein GL258_05645 [Macrococcus canis]
MNSDLELRPCLIGLNYYIGQTGRTEDDPLKDFNRISDGSELGFNFVISGMNKIQNPLMDNNEITLVFLYYDKIGQKGFKVNNLWTMNLNKNDMKQSYLEYKFTLTKIYFDHMDLEYDLTHTYQLLKIFVLPKPVTSDEITEDLVSHWMTWTQLNEIYCSKIPIINRKVY